MNIKHIIPIISMVAVVLLLAGRMITVGYIVSNNNDVDSFSELAEYFGIIAGILMMIVGVQAFKTSITYGIIPFGVGCSIFVVCSWILYLKSL